MYLSKDRLTEEHEQILFLIKQTETQLNKCRPGRLVRRKNIKGDSYFEVNESKEILSKSMEENHKRVQEIKRHAFLSMQLEILKKDEMALRKIMTSYENYDPLSIGEKVSWTYRFDYEEEQAEVEEFRDYDLASKYPRDTGHFAYDGTPLRSMAETVIYNMLSYYGVNFSYEKRLAFCDENGPYSRYPDFTIRRKDGKVFYWEHVGMFGKEDYKKAFVDKLGDYFENDIVMGNNLIVTFSSKDYAVNSEGISRLIRSMLL